MLAAAPLAGCSSCSSETPAPDAGAAAPPPAADGLGKRRASTEVTLVAPKAPVDLAQPLIFRWEGPADKPVRGWMVTVMVRSEAPLWSSAEQVGTELEAPAELRSRLEPGQVYSWRVVGRLEAGGRIRSELGRLVTAATP
jgi:hypothetical protein